MRFHLELLYQKWLLIPNVTVKQGKDTHDKEFWNSKPTQLLLMAHNYGMINQQSCVNFSFYYLIVALVCD